MLLALPLKTGAAAELGIAAVRDYEQASIDLVRLAIRFVRDAGRTSDAARDSLPSSRSSRAIFLIAGIRMLQCNFEAQCLRFGPTPRDHHHLRTCLGH
jgi:hypothetical protein